MFFKSILENKIHLFSSAILILIPYYTWKLLYTTYKSLKAEYSEASLFHQKHNCVIMYAENKGMMGWPPHKARIKLDIFNLQILDTLYEPLIYYIDTAEKGLDVAYMLINVSAFFDAFLKAHRRGVKVRLLVNFEHCHNELQIIRKLKKEGIIILTYISNKPDMASIMHYKFIVKDSRYVLTGSMNLTNSGVLNNFEDIVISSNMHLAETFQENFNKCWKFVSTENENLINKTLLMDANIF